MQYHIWTLGCQMNVADSQRLASELERLGHHAAPSADEADILVINTCVVRQSAEDKAYGRLRELARLKERQPDKIIGLMGCLVGVRDPLRLRAKLPHVDVFLPPSDPGPMIDFLRDRQAEREVRALDAAARASRDDLQDALEEGAIILPEHERGALVSAHVASILGATREQVKEALATFQGVPHRMERVAEIGGVLFINNSMCTNAAALEHSLQATPKPCLAHRQKPEPARPGGFACPPLPLCAADWARRRGDPLRPPRSRLSDRRICGHAGASGTPCDATGAIGGDRYPCARVRQL